MAGAGVITTEKNLNDIRRGMTVQTISETTVYGVVGYRMDCQACGAKSGHDTEVQAVAAARAHGKRKHS